MLDPLLFNIAIMLFSLLLVFWAADVLVVGITRYATKLRLATAFSGVFIVGLASSTPEMIAALAGLAANDSGVFFGTLLGANLSMLALITGIVAVVRGNTRLELGNIGKPVWLVVASLLLPLVFLIDGRIARWEGIVLIAVFAVLFVRSWMLSPAKRTTVDLKSIWKPAIIFIGSLIALLLAARWLVFSSIGLATLAGIPTILLAATVLALSGSVPDLAISMSSSSRGKSELGIGEILGSAWLELLLALGLVGVFWNASLPPILIYPFIAGLALAVLTLGYSITQKRLTRTSGWILIGIYAAFLVAVFAVV